MTAIYQGIESTTWHDQKPSHPKMSNVEFDARRAEEIAWKAYDAALDSILDNPHPTQKDQDELDHARKLAEQRSHKLALVLHAKHYPTETTNDLDF